MRLLNPYWYFLQSGDKGLILLMMAWEKNWKEKMICNFHLFLFTFPPFRLIFLLQNDTELHAESHQCCNDQGSHLKRPQHSRHRDVLWVFIVHLKMLLKLLKHRKCFGDLIGTHVLTHLDLLWTALTIVFMLKVSSHKSLNIDFSKETWNLCF